MNSIMVVLGKELRRIFTDRRLVITTFILPALTIAIMYSAIGYFAGNLVDTMKNERLEVAVVNMPDSLRDEFKENAIEIKYEDDDEKIVKEKIYDKDLDAYIKFDKDFDESISNFKNATIPSVNVIYNPKVNKINMRLGRVKSLFDDYKINVIKERLGSGKYAEVFNLEKNEIELRASDEASVGGLASAMLPMFITIFIFSGAMGIGIDSISGEKERGTFAIMLVAPIDRTVIIVTKILSIAVVSFLSTVSSFIGILISIPFAKRALMTNGSESVEIVHNLSISGSRLFMMFVTMLSIMMVSVTLIAIISLYAKSVKEANTYVTPVYLVVMLASFLPMYSPAADTPLYMYSVPIYNGITSMIKILNGEATFTIILITFLSSLIVTGVLVYVMRKMIYKESVVFPS